MNNPWEEVELNVYESHMSLENVYQLQLLNQLTREQLETHDISTVMILGVAGGNGLEHVNKDRIQKVYGVDVNSKYLAECKKRYEALGDILKTICVDLLDDDLQLPCAELLIANLLVEYIGYECFQKVVALVEPRCVSCVIQVNTGESFVSESPYLHSFDCLEQVHHQINEALLVDAMKKTEYEMQSRQERELPNGKKLVRIDFIRKGWSNYERVDDNT